MQIRDARQDAMQTQPNRGSQEKASAVTLTISTLIKGVLSGLRRFLATKSPLKRMKNAFYFTLKGLFVIKTFKLLN